MWWQYYLIWLGIVSFITFLLYGIDKARAKSGGWRIRESILHFLAIIGGFPGGWAGRSIFHHKTQKGVFTVVLVVSTLIHGGIVYWLILR